MFAKPLLGLAALGIVSMWGLRARSPLGSRIRSQGARRPAMADALRQSPNAAESLAHSHAMGVAGGIEMPVAQEADTAPADAGQPGAAAWPATREFLRGA